MSFRASGDANAQLERSRDQPGATQQKALTIETLHHPIPSWLSESRFLPFMQPTIQYVLTLRKVLRAKTADIFRLRQARAFHVKSLRKIRTLSSAKPPLGAT